MIGPVQMLVLKMGLCLNALDRRTLLDSGGVTAQLLEKLVSRNVSTRPTHRAL